MFSCLTDDPIILKNFKTVYTLQGLELVSFQGLIKKTTFKLLYKIFGQNGTFKTVEENDIEAIKLMF